MAELVEGARLEIEWAVKKQPPGFESLSLRQGIVFLYFLTQALLYGEVAEWFKAHVWKACRQ